MTEPSKAVTDAIQSGNNGAAARAAGDDLPASLVRDPIYALIYGGGLIVYGALIVAFLL
ncbi:MAG: hypothetical protein VYB65_06415 [Myxococcota bacterium]|jgi:hypothetical protein|nr:hypothetical protein [Myxococcota bacterium]